MDKKKIRAANNLAVRKYRKKHPDRVRRAVKKWQDAHPEAAARHNKKAYYKNREQRLIYQNLWYLDNREEIHRRWREKRKANPAWFLYHSCKARAKRLGREFTITVEDIKIPKVCPVLGIPIQAGAKGEQRHNWPSVDRIRNNQGYTPKNILVISHRANALKSDATVQELLKIVRYIQHSTT